jgi:hypothetical protein
MGLVTDLTAVRWSFLVPVGAFLYLTALAVMSQRPGPAPSTVGNDDLRQYET